MIAPPTFLIQRKGSECGSALTAISKRLINSPFVRGVINSLPFNPKQKDPIKAVFDDGRIEFVLCQTDAGYGLVIQSTGRNLNETQRIAELLKQKYF